jgi:hypothetical protein
MYQYVPVRTYVGLLKYVPPAFVRDTQSCDVLTPALRLISVQVRRASHSREIQEEGSVPIVSTVAYSTWYWYRPVERVRKRGRQARQSLAPVPGGLSRAYQVPVDDTWADTADSSEAQI